MSKRGAEVTSWKLLRMIGAADLPKAAKHMLCQSVAYLDLQTLRMYPSLGRLATETGWSERQLQRVLREDLIPRGILVPETPRRGGRKRGTGAGISTVYRLGLPALAQCGRPEANPDTESELDGAYPDTGAPEPRQGQRQAPTPEAEYPDTVSDKPPENYHKNDHPTTTDTGGGGGDSAQGTGDSEPTGEELLRQFGATNEDLIRQAAKRYPADLIAELLRYARREGVRAGLVLQMLTGKQLVPPEVVDATEMARERRKQEAAALAEARDKLDNLPPDRLKAARERAGVAHDDWTAEGMRAIGRALEELGHEEERERFRELCRELTPEERESVRCRFQAYSFKDVLRQAELSPRMQSGIVTHVEQLRSASPEGLAGVEAGP